MNLADKPCYPTYRIMTNSLGMPMVESIQDGLTFRERLIIALAGNSEVTNFKQFGKKETLDEYAEINAVGILTQADAIIKELENQK